MADNQQSEPYQLNYVTTNHFYIEIDNAIQAAFSECSGLGVTLEHQTFQEGGVNNQQRFFIGKSTFSDVTLKRGITDDIAFWQWIEQVLNGVSKQRKSVNILIFNQAGETMQTWTLSGAIPVGWKAPSFQADGNQVAIEELTLAYEGLTIKSTASTKKITGEARGNLGYFVSPS